MTNSTRGEQVQRGGGVAEQASGEELERLRLLEVPAVLSVNDLAVLMDVDPVEIIKALMRNGHMMTINDVIERDLAALIAPLLGYSVLPLAERAQSASSLVVSSDDEDPSVLEPRPPVVTILGHVDHGKTTLLDGIRDSHVVDREAGGITQHIGAYQVEYSERPITFLDTPGHKAFTAMRARGAQVTDIVVLVVAADDGIMPQTIEAIDHARAAEVPIVVAINKVDRPDADVERVKRQLAEQNLLIEDWGGEVIAVPVSALQGQGVPDLLDNIQVVAEIAELKANPHREARAVVIEARIDKSRGVVATVLVQTGTLSVGDNLVVGENRGRVRAMFDDRGRRIDNAGPSRPVEILGLNQMPSAGEILMAVADERTGRRLAEKNQRSKEQERSKGLTLADVYSRIESGEAKALNLILKTDVQGSIGALRSSLEQLNTDKARVNIVRAASGTITESDVLLASASNAVIFGFNSRPEPGARLLANQDGIEIRFYDVIYNLSDDVAKALEGLLEPVFEDVVEGRATVRAVFGLGRKARAAGIYVNEGRIVRDSLVRVIRGGAQVFSGSLASLKHFRDDVREVAVGFEGGISLQGFNDYEEGDVIEAHRTHQVK